jgi:hypothetical protein
MDIFFKEPPGPPPSRPRPNGPENGGDPRGKPHPKKASMVWIVGPILAVILFVFLVSMLQNFVADDVAI